jgi:ATP adenylyltransferase
MSKPRRSSKRRPQKNIWAPWRIEYILGEKDGKCFLCRMFRDKDDASNHLLLRGKTCAVVMNRYPYAPGHLMVAPYRHTAGLDDMTPAEATEMMALTRKCVAVLKRTMRPHGFNIGINLGDAAGAGLKDHIHMHIVPRWHGDTNFMPVLADIKVIPQALDEAWLALHPYFRRR